MGSIEIPDLFNLENFRSGSAPIEELSPVQDIAYKSLGPLTDVPNGEYTPGNVILLSTVSTKLKFQNIKCHIFLLLRNTKACSNFSPILKISRYL